MESNYLDSPRIVVTVHGIQTSGKWQKMITPHLAKQGLVPYHIDYGWFNLLFFLFPFTRNKQLRRVESELRELITVSGVRRVNVIAHSFGTFIAMEVLRRNNGAIKFDRVVLTGSIVARDFDWKTAFDKEWVMAARNERASSDWVVSFASLASSRMFKWLTRLNAGNSGRHVFLNGHPALIDNCIEGGHSETHNPMQFSQWARFLSYPCFTGDSLRAIQVELQAFRQFSASVLRVSVDSVRTNLFAPIEGALRIVPGATDNMLYAPELNVRIQRGHGGTGVAFDTGYPCTVIRQGQSWTGRHLPGDELKKINPALKWVISLPVWSERRSKTVCVVNVDGLDALPDALSDTSNEEYKAIIVALHYSMKGKFTQYIDTAFIGDNPAVAEA